MDANNILKFFIQREILLKKELIWLFEIDRLIEKHRNIKLKQASLAHFLKCHFRH